MKISKDITGQKFGRLTAIEYSHNVKHQQHWLFKCECGNKKIINKYRVCAGTTKSCGCFAKEVAKKTQKSNFFKHGLTGERVFEIYRHMKKRCYLKENKDYKNYGERGIKICKEWLESPEKFFAWAIANGYKDNLTIDRIDVNGNYEPANCRWVDVKTQGRNKRNTLFAVHKGIKKPLIEWCEILKLNYGSVKQGIRCYNKILEDYL